MARTWSVNEAVVHSQQHPFSLSRPHSKCAFLLRRVRFCRSVIVDRSSAVCTNSRVVKRHLVMPSPGADTVIEAAGQSGQSELHDPSHTPSKNIILVGLLPPNQTTRTDSDMHWLRGYIALLPGPGAVRPWPGNNGGAGLGRTSSPHGLGAAAGVGRPGPELGLGLNDGHVTWSCHTHGRPG